MSRLLATVVLAAALSIPAIARAKVSLQARLGVAGGWTDNVLNGPVAKSDFLAELAPSLILTAAQPRGVQRLAYDFIADLFLHVDEANSYTHQLTWTGMFLPSKVTTLLVSAAVQEGRLNTFNLTSGSALTPVMVVPAGATTFFGALASDAFAWDIDAHWRFNQSLLFNVFVPLDPSNQPNSFEVDQHLAATRSWQRDSLGFDYRLDYTAFTAAPSSPAQQVILNSPVAKWLHDFGHFWNTEADLGFIEASLPSGGSANWQPAALAAVRYLHPNGSVALEYSHTVQPNPFLAQTFSIDEAALRGSVPFGSKSRVALSASGAYQYARQIDFSTGGELSTVHLVMVDATLSWTPIPEIQLYARYQYFDQIGHPTDPQPEPTFSRNLVMIGLIGTWPGEAAARVPVRMAQRVDRADDVGIPELHSPPPKP